MKVIELAPPATGIKGVDLKTATSYPGSVMDVADAESILFVFTIDNTGGGALGLAKLTLDLLLKDGITILKTVDVLTLINTKVDGTAIFYVDRILGADEFGDTGTLGADIDLFKAANFIKPTITVTEANNGTTCVGSLRAVVRRP
jgi:hypothetical protein